MYYTHNCKIDYVNVNIDKSTMTSFYNTNVYDDTGYHRDNVTHGAINKIKERRNEKGKLYIDN